MANPGDLDRSFGRGGIVKLNVEPKSSNVGDELAVDSSGRIVVLTRSADEHSTLLRFTSSGSLDRTFGEGGSISVPGGPWTALVIQPDGRILIGGAWEGRFSVARYGSSGELDPGFGAGTGMVSRRIDSGMPGADKAELGAEITELAALPDGRIVALGHLTLHFHRFHATRRDFVLRLLGDGNPDPGFGQDSVAFLSPVQSFVPPRQFYFTSLTVQDDGRVLVGGDIDGRLAVVRLSTGGEFDESWGRDGIVVSGLETHESDSGVGGNFGDARAVLIQSRARIIAVGKFQLLGLRPDGNLDRSFGIRGESFPSGYAGPFPEIEDAALDSKGRILATGRNRDRTAILRFLPSGGLDPSFSGDGIARPNVSRVKGKVKDANAHENATAIAVSPRDRPVTAGWAFVDRTHAVLSLTRLLGANGRPPARKLQPRPAL